MRQPLCDRGTLHEVGLLPWRPGVCGWNLLFSRICMHRLGVLSNFPGMYEWGLLPAG